MDDPTPDDLLAEMQEKLCRRANVTPGEAKTVIESGLAGQGCGRMALHLSRQFPDRVSVEAFLINLAAYILGRLVFVQELEADREGNERPPRAEALCGYAGAIDDMAEMFHKAHEREGGE